MIIIIIMPTVSYDLFDVVIQLCIRVNLFYNKINVWKLIFKRGIFITGSFIQVN